MGICNDFLARAWKKWGAFFEGTVDDMTSLQVMETMAQSFEYWKSRESMLLLCDASRLIVAADEAENLTINKTPSDELTEISAIKDARITQGLLCHRTRQKMTVAMTPVWTTLDMLAWMELPRS
jgi:hypothetical protein